MTLEQNVKTALARTERNDTVARIADLQKSCRGTSLSFDLIQAENAPPVVINEVPVAMDAVLK